MGSSSYITDVNGEVSQHIEYFAFGETFVEEHSNTGATPYKFNAKELDDETGLYYYGARYYDPKTSVWQSVDPLAEKYLGWSPYVYTFNNPIAFTDPDGRDPWPWGTDWIGSTFRFFMISAYNNGVPRNNWPRMGRIFEDTVLRSMQISKNTRTFYPSPLAKRGFIPDAVGNIRKGYGADGGGPVLQKIYKFHGAHFIDAKYTQHLQFEQKYNPAQIKGFIDVLSNVKGADVETLVGNRYVRTFDANAKASDYGAATLTFITPTGTTIAPEILEYATSKNVQILQRFMEQDKEDNSTLRVSNLVIPLNMAVDKKTGKPNFVQPPIAPAGDDTKVNWSKK